MSMTTYRIYTQDLPGLVNTVARFFDGAHLAPGLGLWKGQTEDSVVITLVCGDFVQVTRLAEAIRVEYGQESVLVTATEEDRVMVVQGNKLQGAK